MFKFGSKKPRKFSSVLVVDAGTSTFRILQVQKKGDRLQVNAAARLTLSDNARENRTEENVSEALRLVAGQAKTKQKQVHLTINSPSTRIWYVETPVMEIADIRQAIRLSPTAYLRQDCADLYIDCAPLNQVTGQAGEAVVNVEDKPKAPVKETEAKPDAKISKMKVIVVGAYKNDIRFYVAALSKAGMEVPSLCLNPLAVTNAFEYTLGQPYQDQIFALVDIGFRTSSFNIIQHGKPVLTRLVDWGGDHISQYVAQMLSVEWKTAEEEKIKMSEPVQHLVRDSLAGLVTHVRSSLDFFEAEYGLAPSQVGVAGGSAQSPWIVQCLGEMLGIQCEAWKPNESFIPGPQLRNENLSQLLSPDWADVTGAAISYLM